VPLPIHAAPLQGLSDAAFLDLLIEQDIELRLKDGKLRINAPTGAVTDEMRTEMVRRKDFLLATCQAAPQLNGALILRPQSLQNNQAPLTYAQERLWLLERFHPGNFAYNIPEVFALEQPLDRDLIQQALATVAKRQDVLRTRMLEVEGRVLQQVEACVSIPVLVSDLSYLEESFRDEHLKMLLRQESRRPFDLTVAPFARFHLYLLGGDRQVLLINLHHIIADRWSMRILYRELHAAYQAHAQGREPMLPKLPIQYSDYALWERSPAHLRQQQMQYWQQQLADLPEPIALPFARPAASGQPIEGAICVVRMTPEDTAALYKLANAQGASIYMVLLAAYCALLRRYTGASDMCIGSPVSERNYPETEPLIGLFVNTLVMRCKVPAHASFLEVLRGVRDTVLDAHAHRDVPFQQILRNLQLDQGNSATAGSPLFQTMLAFDPLPVEGVGPDTEVELDPGFAKFDLTLQLREEETRIAGWFEYRTDIIDAEAISRFAAAFLRLVRGILANPAKPLETIDILAAEERRLLLKDWNATQLDFPSEATVHELFERQAASTPDSIAVIDGDRRISYRQMNSHANQVARTLIQQGIATEDIVGIHLARSAEMIAALLGVLKAGAAYLPLDQQYPEARLSAMIEDSGCKLVITDASEDPWPFAAAKALALPAFHGADGENPDVAVAPGSLAYVIYTSGSTGKPKGVAIEHHSTVAFLTWAHNAFSAQVLKGTLASTPISFDLSVFEIFVPLTAGHTVILAADVLHFSKLPAMREVTLLTTVPSAAAALLDTYSIPPSLKHINLAGEPLTAALVDRLYAETGIDTVTDLYGPTETTTYSTWTTRRRNQPATIGRPIANTRVYLVDDAMQLVPLGMAGELLIAGEGVARGYLHRPEITAERFISLKHLGEPSRAYRTGDLCRYNADGTLVYLGRMDQQVKVNGFRVELGEVETVLRSHPSVEDAVVTAHHEKNAAVLIAAVRLARGRSLDAAELIRHQSAALPLHMVARKIAAVDHFPRTANGKLDRNRLAALIADAQSVHRIPVPPRDEIERELVSIWQDGFLEQAIGIDDDFFEIGGHSLLALRIFSEIEVRLGHRMMLSVLFQAPTIRLLAKHLRVNRP
jgi:amino acid adenylation domain-containing protein